MSPTTQIRHVPAVSAGEEHNRFISRAWSIVTEGGAISARTLTPVGRQSHLPPLLALHGIGRDADAMFDAFAPAAVEAGRALIVPLFSAEEWPTFQRIGQARPDLALLGLLHLLRDTGVMPVSSLDVFGYSGGAQLAHRLAMFYPQRIRKLHLAAAGWYCWPDAAVPFPVGLGDGRRPKAGQILMPRALRDQFTGFLELPVTVYVGSEDIERDDALRTEDGIDEMQGATRHERARRYVEQLNAAARAKGIAARAEFVELPGCGHSFSQCAEATDLVARVLA